METLLARVFFDTPVVEVWDIETESLVSRLVGHSSDIDEHSVQPGQFVDPDKQRG